MLLRLRRRVPALPWTRVMAVFAAACATAGMVTVTVTQLAVQRPAAATASPLPASPGEPLYPEPPPAAVPDGEPVPWPDRAERTHRGSAAGIPVRVLAAYRDAADVLARRLPGCRLPVPLLAAIGRVESGHARGGAVDARGNTQDPILGPRLDGGPGIAAIRDTDGGRYDGDTVWDRAVGAMQFIPSTWRRWASDGNADGTADPHNVDDAALAAGHYLCASGGDLATPDGLRRAVLAYNHSEQYLNLVMAWLRVYSGDVVAVPASPHAEPAPTGSEAPRRETPRRERPSEERPPPSTTTPPREPTPSEQPPESTTPELPLSTTVETSRP